MQFKKGDKVQRNTVHNKVDKAVVLIKIGDVYKVELTKNRGIRHWHKNNMLPDEQQEEDNNVGFKEGDRVVRISAGGRGQKATVIKAVSVRIYEVGLEGSPEVQEWHASHFAHDPSPLPMQKPIPSETKIGIGSIVSHTAHKHGVLVGKIVGQDIMSERWEMEYDEGKRGSWLKKYAVRYDMAKDTTLLGVKADTVIYDDVSDHMRWVAENRAVWIKQPINNKSEEDKTMKLTIEDHTTVNNIPTNKITTDGFLALISDAEGEVKRLEALQEGSEAIRASSAITNSIKALKAGIERCVVFMDKADS